MAEVTIKKRVHRLETLMAQLIKTVDRTDQQIAQTQRNLDQFSAETRETRKRSEREMQEFKTEMQASRKRSEREMQEFKTEMQASRERSEREMQEFKTEMQVSREQSEREMQVSREQSEREMIEFKQELRDIDDKMRQETERYLRKMGTLVEDMVAPSIPQILQQVLGYPEDEMELFAIRLKKRHPVTKQRQEYDVVAVCGDYLCINETKSSLTPEHVKTFAEKTLLAVREFFPEYAGKQLIGIIATFYMDESLVRHCERLGLIALGFGDNVMEVLNQPGFVPKSF